VQCYQTYTGAGNFKVSLYDFETDIGEEHDLVEQPPEAVERLLDLTMPLYKKTVLKKKVVSLKLF